ncbi:MULTISPECIES: DEAD/DEAH box helicase [unclassified Leucobacter]|uniref:DEAD/DEAH box helicase n=1 Tax=unclassified Leucobacter TaxID=2621730 RepID=UPI00301772DC
MAQKGRRGFKPPSNYEPGRKPARAGKRWAGGRDSAAEDGKPTRGARGTGRDSGAGHPRSAHDGKRQAEGRPARQDRADRSGRSTPSNRSAGAERSAEAARPQRSAGAVRSQRRPAPARAEQTPVTARSAPSEPVVLQRLDARITTAAEVQGVAFSDLGLGANIVRVLSELGADQPFPIQAATIPDAIAGRDVLGRARTGSGKTIAFGAALVERLLQLKAEGAFAGDAKPARDRPRRGERAPKRAARNPKALILAPTRELALQIDRTVQPIARSVGFFTAQLVGGVPLDPQVHALERGVDIVIGTPGRVRDLINRRKLDLREVLVSVIDEADHMCELGFLEPVQRVLRDTVRGGQRLLFSATLDSGVSDLVAEFLRNPAVHEVAGEAVSEAEHRVLVVLREHKDRVLVELASRSGRTMVFTRTRAYAERLAELFEEAGLRVTALHGNLSQARRERNLERFASGKASVLVATDVAARGLHIDDVDLVVQADPPDEYKTYLHRAGRTARAGRGGLVLTVIPRTRQQRTRELLEQAEIVPASFGDHAPGDDPTAA